MLRSKHWIQTWRARGTGKPLQENPGNRRSIEYILDLSFSVLYLLFNLIVVSPEPYTIAAMSEGASGEVVVSGARVSVLGGEPFLPRESQLLQYLHALRSLV